MNDMVLHYHAIFSAHSHIHIYPRSTGNESAAPVVDGRFTTLAARRNQRRERCRRHASYRRPNDSLHHQEVANAPTACALQRVPCGPNNNGNSLPRCDLPSRIQGPLLAQISHYLGREFEGHDSQKDRHFHVILHSNQKGIRIYTTFSATRRSSPATSLYGNHHQQTAPLVQMCKYGQVSAGTPVFLSVHAPSSCTTAGLHWPYPKIRLCGTHKTR
ncbi:uncharacterized protein F5Z01DRAFT_462587 [Emericellopsis atlantica]|uniref:Uncharacterized protein n=1 Tax=Emericellopsis atlantica TaxID=2614577 RepID=A0A9P7ZS27_9HYPO|nr:uncharacterized protein F5Z01DRAFT_462587 [Emericellopsis atlantica]KAG9257288.1 hypothetical protein F5Z01DRAFT_462587 [Emericellopsis atlantica]